MTLYILDIIHGKFQTHTIHITSVTVDQILALKWPIWSIERKVASLFPKIPMLNPGQNDSRKMPLKVEYLKN